MRSSLLAVVLLAGSVSLPAIGDDTMVTLKPEQIGQIFCFSRLGNDEAVLDGILTAELKTAIADAWSKDEAYEKQYPGEKPPLGDGIPWQAWPDYAAECTIGLVTLMKTDAKVEINYTFPEDAAANFTDVLLLKRVDARLRHRLLAHRQHRLFDRRRPQGRAGGCVRGPLSARSRLTATIGGRTKTARPMSFVRLEQDRAMNRKSRSRSSMPAAG